MSRCWRAIAAAWRTPGGASTNCPLGAAALAGTSFPIDRDMTSAGARLRPPMANSLDAVSARDFALEVLAAAAICATHLSRLAEEIVIWCSAHFGFVRLERQIHHRLLDHAAKAQPGRRRAGARQDRAASIGALATLLTVMKGLPLAYSKDMQEDKELDLRRARHAVAIARRP